MPKILVTGGTGQIGGFVCKELLDRGHEVVAYDYKPNPQNVAEIASRVKLVNGDITNFEQLKEIVRSEGVTDIIHLAALLVLESKERPASAIQVNCVGTNNVFEIARQLNLRRVLYASSVAVYGIPSSYTRKVVNEDDFPRCPVDPYSITKFLDEWYGKYYGQTYGMDLVCLRITATWGPGRYSGYTGQFNDFVRNVAIGKPQKYPVDFAYRGSKLNWLYIKDTARIFAHCIEVDKRKIKRTLYNAGSKNPFKARDVIREIKALLPDSKIQFNETVKPTEVSLGIAGPSGLQVDCSRLYKELGFKEEFALAAAFKDMANLERSRAGLPPI